MKTLFRPAVMPAKTRGWLAKRLGLAQLPEVLYLEENGPLHRVLRERVVLDMNCRVQCPGCHRVINVEPTGRGYVAYCGFGPCTSPLSNQGRWSKRPEAAIAKLLRQIEEDPLWERQ